MATLTDKVRRLTTVPDEFLSKIPTSQSQVYDRVIELLSQLEIKGGQFAMTAKNLRIATEISNQLRDVLLGSDYVKYVTEFASEFDQQATINNRLFKQAFPEFKVTELAKNVVMVAKTEAIDLLLNRASDSDFVAPLSEIIQQAVISNSGYRETLTSIRDFIEGNPEQEGAMLRYSKTYAHDTFAIADRSYTSVVSEELGAEWFKYSGDTIATTRPFCEERHNQFFYYKEIEAWGAGEKTEGMAWPKNGTWAGRIPETNESTIYSYSGGINCRHSIMPQSIFAVPLEDIKRNIANGNFSPSDKERELLGL